jgi:hypothetical protein
MVDWLSTFNNTMGMYNAHIITTIFGAFCVTFAVCICWGKMVETFGPIGGMMCAAIIVGTFWVMNHKLPGFGIHPEQMTAANGKDTMQFGLIAQTGAWIDMGWAIGMGLWVLSLIETKPEKRLENVVESSPRLLFVILGGVIGGAIVGLSGFTGAQLFGWGGSPVFGQ